MNSCSVYIANSTCANVDTFVLSVFPSQVWRRNLLILVVDPQRRRMFLLVRRFYYLLNFQLFRKGSHAEGMLFIFPCSLAFSPKCSREEFGCSLSLSLSPSLSSSLWVSTLHMFASSVAAAPACLSCLPACPGQCDRRCIPFRSRCGMFCLIYPSAACQEEPPRAAVLLLLIFHVCSKTPNEPPKTVSVDKFQRRAGEGSATLRHFGELLTRRLPRKSACSPARDLSVVTFLYRSSHC